MSYKVLFRPEAESDLLDSFMWYEKSLSGLGKKFLDQVDLTISSIVQNPQKYPIIYKNIRRALTQKFPLGIHYIIEENKIIVLAIFHFSRNPKNWKSRDK